MPTWLSLILGFLVFCWVMASVVMPIYETIEWLGIFAFVFFVFSGLWLWEKLITTTIDKDEDRRFWEAERGRRADEERARMMAKFRRQFDEPAQKQDSGE